MKGLENPYNHNKGLPFFNIPEFTGIKPTITSKTIIFHHLTSTGGNTFSDILWQKFPKDTKYYPKNGSFLTGKTDFEQLSDEEKRHYRVILGHHNFGVHKILPQTYTYITIVRDPVMQFVSNYFAMRKKIDQGFFPDSVLTKCPTLESWVENRLKSKASIGYLVQDVAQLSKVWLEKDQYVLPKDIPINESGPKVLANINKYFSFVGITEFMDESLFLLAYRCGWDSLPLWETVQNTPGRPDKQNLSLNLLQDIAKITAPSVLVYDLLVKNFHETFNKLFVQFPGLALRLQQYRKAREEAYNIKATTHPGSREGKTSAQKTTQRNTRKKEAEFIIPEFENITPTSNADTHIFCHLPSSGGNSVFNFVKRHTEEDDNYCPAGGSFEKQQSEIFSFTEEKKRSFKFYHGHENMGLHTILPQKCDYFTFLREPVTTFVSEYYYAWSIAVTKGVFFEYYTDHKNINDLADHLLSKRTSPMGTGYIVHQLNQFAPPWIDEKDYIARDDINPPEAEQRTRQNLEKYFFMVGITERFDESMFLLARKLGWKSLPYWHHKGGVKNRPKVEEHPKLVLKKIEMLVGHSITIYNEQLKKFNEEYNAMLEEFPGLEKTVARYKQERKNAVSKLRL